MAWAAPQHLTDSAHLTDSVDTAIGKSAQLPNTFSAPPPPHSKAPKQSTLKFLVVDDSHSIRNFLIRRFAMEGIVVESASNGVEALSIMQVRRETGESEGER